jgi:hypothetical protein
MPRGQFLERQPMQLLPHNSPLQRRQRRLRQGGHNPGDPRAGLLKAARLDRVRARLVKVRTRLRKVRVRREAVVGPGHGGRPVVSRRHGVHPRGRCRTLLRVSP